MVAAQLCVCACFVQWTVLMLACRGGLTGFNSCFPAHVSPSSGWAELSCAFGIVCSCLGLWIWICFCTCYTDADKKPSGNPCMLFARKRFRARGCCFAPCVVRRCGLVPEMPPPVHARWECSCCCETLDYGAAGCWVLLFFHCSFWGG